MTLKLNEEQNGLKLIQVNDGLVVGSNPVFIPNIGQYMCSENGVVLDKVTSHNIHLLRPTDRKIIFATSNLNLDGVPVIEEKISPVLKLINSIDYGCDLYKRAGGTGNERQIKLLSSIRPELIKIHNISEPTFTEEQVKAAFEEGRKSARFNAHLDGTEFLNAEEYLKSLKQPKVEITFENNKPVKCIML